MSFEPEDLTQSINQWSTHLEEQRRQLEAEVQRLKVFQLDYDALEKQLQTLPDETVRPAMASIPIGSLAFMPGKLIHTNEITVCLGADYYVERSAKQALTILNRRREVVNENLQLVEAQLNGLVTKKETGYGAFPSNELGVNEEGLPIMEIREELPDVEPAQKSDKAVPAVQAVMTEKAENPLKDENARAANVWEDKEYKDFMAMLQKLEKEEEEEMAQDTGPENVSDHSKTYSDGSEEEDEDDSEHEDDEDEYMDNLYDTEIADNLFDQFDDDEEYATQGIVDYEDATVYEEEGFEKGQADSVKENVGDDEVVVMQSVRETQPAGNNATTTSTFTNLTDIAPEVKVLPSKPKKASRFKAERERERLGIQQAEDNLRSVPVVQDAQTASAVSDVVAKVSPQTSDVASSIRSNKVSLYKAASLDPSTKEHTPDDFADKKAARTSAVKEHVSVDNGHQVPVVEISSPSKKISQFKAARQQGINSKTDSPRAPFALEIPLDHINSVATDDHGVQDPVQNSGTMSEISVEGSSTSPKKISKFKMARQLEQEKQQTMSSNSSRGIPAVLNADAGKGKKTIYKQVDPSLRIAGTADPTPKKKVSRFKAAREQDRSAGGETASPTEIKPECPSDKQKDETYSSDGKSKRRVTWDEVATVQEHDRFAAPADVTSDTYMAPVKQGEKVYDAPQTVKSPADIFNLVQAQRQAIMDDGYPSLETGEDEFEVDMDDLGRSAKLEKQELWQLKDESEQPLIIKEIKKSGESSLPVVPKTKLDTKVMRGAVIEHDIEPVDVDEVEMDMDFREVTSSYHNIRNNFVAAMGGYTFEPKDTIEVFDEELPLPSKTKAKEQDQVAEQKPKKVSRFKAARMAAFEKEQ